MYRIIDSRGTGKSGRLMLLAKEYNGIIVCSNPRAMEYKAHEYGIVGVDFLSYEDFFNHRYNPDKKIFLDEIENYIKRFNSNILGYTLSIGD